MDLKVLDQIRAKYKRAADQYGQKIFSLKELESRITHLLETRGSLELFAKAEMDFYEKAMKIAKSREEESQKKAHASARIDAILAANNEKIKKYRDIFFDPVASIEIRKMVGALTDWYDICSPLIKYLFRGSDTWNDIMAVQAEIERFYIPGGRAIPVFLRHYTDELKSLASNQKEKAEKKILQSCANSLYKMEKILSQQIATMTSVQKARQISMSAAFDEKSREKWSKLREFDALTECVASLAAIIDDFRLRDLAALGFKNLDK